MRLRHLPLSIAMILPTSAWCADAPATPATATVTLAPVMVSGILPGPGLWKISKDDHVLWLLSTLVPLPNKMEWESLQVERTLSKSQELITQAGLSIKSDIGWFRGMLLIPKALKARKNPEGKTLQDILPPAVYARWSVLKAKYLGNDRSIEQWRPMFAAQELYSAALKDAGLRGSNQIVPKLVKLAKKQDLTVTSPVLTMTIQDPKSALTAFTKIQLDDVACFEKTLARIEHDLPAMKARANAWAVGDVAAIRALPYEDQSDSCNDAVLHNEMAKQVGLENVDDKITAEWQKAIDHALQTNASTLAVLSVSELLKPNGELSRLAAMGYTIEAPQ